MSSRRTVAVSAAAICVRSWSPATMAVAVVDGLEVVEIHKQQRRREAVAAGVQQRLVQAVEKERAVGKAGERVEVRLPVQPLLMPLALAGGRHERLVLEPKAVGESDDKSAQCRIKHNRCRHRGGRAHEGLRPDPVFDRRVAEDRHHDAGARPVIQRRQEDRRKDGRVREVGAENGIQEHTQTDRR